MLLLLFQRAKDGIRTRDPDLGKVVLYQLSYFRLSSNTVHLRRLSNGNANLKNHIKFAICELTFMLIF